MTDNTEDAAMCSVKLSHKAHKRLLVRKATEGFRSISEVVLAYVPDIVVGDDDTKEVNK